MRSATQRCVRITRMFDQLFGSKTRVKLLSLFLNNPGRPYYVREITRKIEEQINSVRRELSNLLSIGIVSSESSNNRLYYEVDEKYQYYPELRAIFTTMPTPTRALKETKDEDQIAKKLRTAGKIELAFLTGSFVRENHIGIDLFVVGDVNKSKMIRVVEELEQEHGRELNYTVMSSEDFNYRQGMNDRFLTNIMDSRKITLIDADQTAPIERTSIEVEPGATPVSVKIEAE